MQKNPRVPYEFEVHPGVICNSVKGWIMDVATGQQQRIEKIEMRAMLALKRTELDSPIGTSNYLEMEIAIEEVYPHKEKKFKGKNHDEKRTGVLRVMASLRNKFRKAHGGEDIIEHYSHRDVFRIKPASLCNQIKGKN